LLLFPTILVTALASSGLGVPARGQGALPNATKEGGGLSLSLLTRLRSCAVPSEGLADQWALPCGGVTLDPLLGRLSLMWLRAEHEPAPAPQRAAVVSSAQGGFWHGDLVGARHFGAGPEVGWVTPNTPHEDLLRQRLVTPGIGVWYSPLPSQLFVGISANTQVSTLAESWFVNALSSEARIGFVL